MVVIFRRPFCPANTHPLSCAHFICTYYIHPIWKSLIHKITLYNFVFASDLYSIWPAGNFVHIAHRCWAQHHHIHPKPFIVIVSSVNKVSLSRSGTFAEQYNHWSDTISLASHIRYISIPTIKEKLFFSPTIFCASIPRCGNQIRKSDDEWIEQQRKYIFHVYEEKKIVWTKKIPY